MKQTPKLHAWYMYDGHLILWSGKGWYYLRGDAFHSATANELASFVESGENDVRMAFVTANMLVYPAGAKLQVRCIACETLYLIAEDGSDDQHAVCPKEGCGLPYQFRPWLVRLLNNEHLLTEAIEFLQFMQRNNWDLNCSTKEWARSRSRKILDEYDRIKSLSASRP